VRERESSEFSEISEFSDGAREVGIKNVPAGAVGTLGVFSILIT
jgi:hypothetical protein